MARGDVAATEIMPQLNTKFAAQLRKKATYKALRDKVDALLRQAVKIHSHELEEGPFGIQIVVGMVLQLVSSTFLGGRLPTFSRAWA
jgi:hypothetical protein